MDITRKWSIGFLISILPLLILTVVVGMMTDWHFTYTLDDAYIHLALAKGINSFHYGINPEEFSAPSSSILWPFLLAPFATLRGYWNIPLIINSIALLGTLLTLQKLLDKRFGISTLKSWALVVTFCLLLNIYGLVFTGMEHSLQVFIVSVIASRLASRRFDYWLYASIYILPLIRYEGLAISLPVLLFLFVKEKNDRKKPIITTVLIALSIASFSAWLLSLGLGYLPSSVMAKQVATAAGSPVGVLGKILSNIKGNIASRPTFIVFSIAFISVFQSWVRDRSRMLLLLALPAVLHLCLGKGGWFGRYEIYILFYIIILAADLWFAPEDARLDSSSKNYGISMQGLKYLFFSVLIVLAFGTKSCWRCTFYTPLGARNIYNQQVQMSVLASKYLDEPVAVNDLGAVALASSKYVLDLWGLGSFEALKKRTGKNSNHLVWIPQLMASKDVNYAIVYDDWITEIPANWIRIASLHLPGQRVTPASDVVNFYATSVKSANNLKSAIEHYKLDNPSKGKMFKFH